MLDIDLLNLGVARRDKSLVRVICAHDDVLVLLVHFIVRIAASCVRLWGLALHAFILLSIEIA